MGISKLKYFDIQRRIVAITTTKSWRNAPHAAFTYHADVTELIKVLKDINSKRPKERKITINTVHLKVIAEGLKAAPEMNAHIKFNRKTVSGVITQYDNIDINMPMIMEDGRMMTIKLKNFETKNIDEMADYIADVKHKLKNTDIVQVMYDVGVKNTMEGLRQGKLLEAVLRLFFSHFGKTKVITKHGKSKKEYYSIPENDRIVIEDATQGTVTVSNVGSIYRGELSIDLLDLVEPQVSAFGISPIIKEVKPVKDGKGKEQYTTKETLPICIAIDHRAIDFDMVVPLLEKFDEIFKDPEIIYTWLDEKVQSGKMYAVI